MAKKTQHNPDYSKDRTADVIKHGSGRAVPNEHWCKNMNLTPDGHPTAAAAFNPMGPKSRPCTHVKTNECDH
jgi:hypothetical protein